MQSRLSGLLLLLTMASVCWGDFLENPSIKLSGFGTLAVDHNGNNEADWVSTTEETTGVGYSRATSISPDSLLAVQADAHINDRWSATAQVMSRSLMDGSRKPYFEWALLKYRPTENSLLRLGRMANDTFLYSDTRFVGYTRPTIHLPFTYMLNPIDQINGGDYEYSFRYNDVFYRLGANYGVFNQKYDIMAPPTGDVFRVHARLGSLHFSADDGNHSFRFSAEEGRVKLMDAYYEMYWQSLDQLLAAGAPGAQEVSSNTQVNDVEFRYVDAAYTYDSDRWLFVGEWTRNYIGTDFTIPSSQSFYLQGGIHIREFTPYVQFEDTRQELNSSNLTPISAPSSLAGQAAFVNGFGQAVQAGTNNSFMYTTGLRWDFHPKMDFKIQYDYIVKPAGAQGRFTYLNPSVTDFYSSRKAIQLFAAGIDFVF